MEVCDEHLAVLAALAIPMTVAAQSAFEGTWKIDLKNVHFSDKPTVLLLQNGVYECQSCVPAFKGKADGTDQPLAGVPYFDTIAVNVVSKSEIGLVFKKAGKVVTTEQLSISRDGNTLIDSFSSSSNTNGGPPTTGKSERVRIAKGPAGSQAISGSWRDSKIDSGSDNGIVWTYKINGKELTMTTPTGQSFTAKLDGTEAPMKGDPGITSVSVKMVGTNVLEETDKRDGKVVQVGTTTISKDGKVVHIRVDDKIQNRTDNFQAIKR